MHLTAISRRIAHTVVWDRLGLQTIRSKVRFMSALTTPPFPKKKNDHREIHSTVMTKSDATPHETNTNTTILNKGGHTIANRFVVTAEVTVSKIFPAGFGWQTSSIIAENTFGFAPDSINFALTTGVGDALGVLGASRGSLAGSKSELWGRVCGYLGRAVDWAFYAGLRAGRTILSGFMLGIEEPTYENSKNDASLSCAIGGATGFFVGTDAVYLPDQNFLIRFVGITDGTPDLVGCAIAGTSTATGFLTTQSVFNVIYPSGKCWND
eukprot:jgi/Psemu1/291440/fgenesh1_pg.699_\